MTLEEIARAIIAGKYRMWDVEKKVKELDLNDGFQVVHLTFGQFVEQREELIAKGARLYHEQPEPWEDYSNWAIEDVKDILPERGEYDSVLVRCSKKRCHHFRETANTCAIDPIRWVEPLRFRWPIDNTEKDT